MRKSNLYAEQLWRSKKCKTKIPCDSEFQKKKKKIGAIKADLTHSCENTKMRLKDS